MKKTNKKRKVALIMSGGGMRCAYAAGALRAIVENYNFIEPDILIAASGSAGSSAYYLSGQYDLAALIWISALGGTRFISFRRRRMLDVDYLIDEVFKKQHPLNLRKLKTKKTRWLLPATRIQDGVTVYLAPKRTTAVYEYLRAAKAVPIVYGKTVTIEGVEYMDGDFGASTDDFIKKALEHGAEDIIVLENHPGGNLEKSTRFIMQTLRAEGFLRGKLGVNTAALRELENRPPVLMPRGARLITIEPSKKTSISSTTRKKLTLRTAFNLGYSDAANNVELKKLLS